MALVSFIVFFVMFTVIGLLFPSNIHSANAVVINNSKGVILKAIRPSADWAKWHPFFNPAIGANVEQHPNDTVTFRNDKHTLLIYDIRSDSNGVSFDMKNEKGRITGHELLALEIPNESSQVQLVWKETEKLKWYPWERFRGLVLEKAKKEYLEAVLNGFKSHLDTIGSN